MAEWTEVNMNTVTHQFHTRTWTCGLCGKSTIYGQEHYCQKHRASEIQNEPAPEIQNQWLPTSPLQIISPDPIFAEIRDLLKQLIILFKDQNETIS